MRVLVISAVMLMAIVGGMAFASWSYHRTGCPHEDMARISPGDQTPRCVWVGD